MVRKTLSWWQRHGVALCLIPFLLPTPVSAAESLERCLRQAVSGSKVPLTLLQALADLRDPQDRRLYGPLGIADHWRRRFNVLGISDQELKQPCRNAQLAVQVLEELSAQHGWTWKTLGGYWATDPQAQWLLAQRILLRWKVREGKLDPEAERFQWYLIRLKYQPGQTQPPSTSTLLSLPERAKHYDPLVREAAARYRIDPALLHAVLWVESGYDPKAVSPKGAQGIAQFMPATAKRFGVADPFDPAQAIPGAARYLRWLLDRFGEDRLDAVIAAYNAGEGAVAQALADGRQIPRIRETQEYVPKVRERMRRLGG